MDSIRENRTKEDILEEIRLERSEDIRNEKCFVIVEGSDDVLFAKKIFCENVICMESFAGKTGLQEILEEDEQESDDIIGIRDRDYVNERDLSQRIFLYDHCCLELMLLADRCTSTSFHQIYYKGKSTCELFLINAMRQLSAYSILRKKNETEELGINFRNVRFGDLVDFASERLNDEELFLRAKEQERYVRCKQEADAVDDQALWNITNGHDICTFLGRLSKSGKANMNEDRVRNVLLVSYRKEDFVKTQLYQDVLSYQRQKHLRFLEE